jgi:hypothetical protein
MGGNADTTTQARRLRERPISGDVVIAGGGLAGVCGAITAARAGIRVVLVQDRPVLGGNASSEVRLWVLGATSHMGNNNRWAREGGVIDELLVENMWRNPEGNAVLFDALLLEFVRREPLIQLLLNTAVDAVTLDGDGAIAEASAYCSQNQIRYRLQAPLFCDASGDGILGFLAGAAFRIGAEAKSEFGEMLAPDEQQQSLLGHSLYFYSRDTGKPVRYVAPSFALEDITAIPRFRELQITDSGCRLWWLEYGGDRDTVYETEEIKWELWKVAYGVWNYIKNSGTFPDADTLTLEWMGAIPGKRESRRFEGDLILTQQDVVEQRTHADAVSCGGWAIDLHPSDGVYSARPGCTQWHSKGVYQIPYRTMYSRNVPNLFLTGRLISASHIAFGSTRVMATCAQNGQAVGMAAALCTESQLRPRDLVHADAMRELQDRLLRSGQNIPGLVYEAREDKARLATITASSTFVLDELPPSGEWTKLDRGVALLLPLRPGPVPCFTFFTRASNVAAIRAELFGSSREGNTTPDVLLEATLQSVEPGDATLKLHFRTSIESAAHYFVMLLPADGVEIALSAEHVTGVLMLEQRMNKAVAKSLVQTPPAGVGIDSFAFWLPARRPQARNLALTMEPPLTAFEPSNVANGLARPWRGANAWLPARNDARPSLRLAWDQPQTIQTIELVFDTDFDHPMESVLMGHPERVMPACVTEFEVVANGRQVLAQVAHNHQTRWKLQLDVAIAVTGIEIVILARGPALPAVFEVRCY